MTDFRPWTLAVAGALLSLPLVAAAHPQDPVQKRELVRLQGTLRPDAEAPAGKLTLLALGVGHPFAATDRRVFTLNNADEAGALAEQYALQGPRNLLARFAAARPDQTITILAEHHPGSKDLFLLTVDLCPPQ